MENDASEALSDFTLIDTHGFKKNKKVTLDVCLSDVSNDRSIETYACRLGETSSADVARQTHCCVGRFETFGRAHRRNTRTGPCFGEKTEKQGLYTFFPG